MSRQQDLIDDLYKRRETIEQAGGGDKLEKRRQQGLLSARQRLLALFQPDTFQEHGAHVRHQAHEFGMDGKDLPADGVGGLEFFEHIIHLCLSSDGRVVLPPYNICHLGDPGKIARVGGLLESGYWVHKQIVDN